MKVYILVEVTYDYYRFQKNIAASHSIEELESIVSSPDNILNRPLFVYDEESKENEAFDNRELNHYWIQELTLSK